MNSKFVKSIIGLLIFLIILLLSLHFLKPIYQEVDRRMKETEQKFLTEFSELTNLSISYSSMSPSILSGICINNIRIYDVSSGDVMLSIDKAVFRYNFINLLKRDFEHAFPVLIISGVKGDFDREKLTALAARVKNARSAGRDTIDAVQNDDSVQYDKKGIFTKKQKELIKKIISVSPAKIQIKNVSISYSWKGKNADFSLDKLTLLREKSGNVSAVCDSGHASMVFGAKKQKAGVKFDFTGNIVPDFSGSSLILSLDSDSLADYTLYKTQFLVRYKDGVVFARSTQQMQPYYVSGQFDFSTKELYAELATDGLNVLSVVKTPLFSKRVNELAATEITIDGSVRADLNTKSFAWEGKGSFFLNDAIIKGGEKIDFDVSGNERDLTINSINADGSLASGTIKGVVNIKEKKPDCEVNITKFKLPNGNNLHFYSRFKTDGDTIYVTIPSLALGKTTFAPIRLTAVPSFGSASFSVELTNPSHSASKSAVVKADGTFVWKGSRTLKVRGSISNLFADTVLYAASYFLKPETAAKLVKKVPSYSSYVTDNEFSFTTDFKHITYSVPAFSVKDSSCEDKSLFVSVGGSESAVAVRNLALTYKKIVLKAEANVSLSPEDKQIVFDTNFDINGNPYTVNGIYEKGHWLNMKGSYGLDVLANVENGVKGSVKLASLPVPVSKYLYELSVESDFDIKSLNDFLVNIKSFQIEERVGRLNRASKISLLGSIDSMGFIIDSLAYSDINSSVAGNGYILWNIVDGILDSATVSFGASNEFTRETIVMDGSFSNPLHSKLTKEVLMKDCYFTFQSDIREFPLMRVIPKQYADDTFNGSITASGTIENPYVLVKLEDFSAQWGAKPIIINGTAELLEGDLYVPDLDFVWGNMKLVDVKADIDLTEFNGDASGDFSIRVLGSRIVRIPLKVTVRNSNEKSEKTSLLERYVPNKFEVSIDSDITAEGLINGSIPAHAEIVREGKNIYFASDPNLGVKGSYLIENGEVTVNVREDRPLHGNAHGYMKKGRVDLTVKDIAGDFSKFTELVSTDYFGLYNGLVSGQVSFSGITSDPTLDGAILVRGLDMTLPLILRDHIVAKNLLVSLTDKRIEVPDARLVVGGEKMKFNFNLNLDRWSVDSIDLNASTIESDRVYVNMGVPMADIKGAGSLKANMHFEDSLMAITVDGNLENSEINIITPIASFSLFGNKASAKKDEDKPGLYESLIQTMDIKVDANVMLGKKVDVTINPLLRALVTPGTKIEFHLDSGESTWSLKGDAVLRGGHISYLSRNFYLKEGRITLNESQNQFDPIISARAETKEKDLDGVLVTLTLSAMNQRLSMFRAQVSSNPARSEAEIMAMMGQIVTGDSTNAGSLFLTGLDYGMQVTVFKKFENALRDLLNFDIFSIRMNVLRNVVRYGTSSGSDYSDSTFRSNKSSLGNFLDNTSVYIGKYFGDAIYADALLQFSYNEDRMRKPGFFDNGIVFHPEIGLELEAPFANIRWNFAPDLEPLRYGGVPSIVSGTSVTLSWRFTF